MLTEQRPRDSPAPRFSTGGYRPTTPDGLQEAFDAAIGRDGMALVKVPAA